MKNIEELEKLNITFNNICKEQANIILETEYPYYKLIEYSSLFERYLHTDKKGQFINLDFEQLYYVAKIDEELSNIILCEFVEIERALKVIVLAAKMKHNIPDSVVADYIMTDEEYLGRVYKVENRQVLAKYPDLSIKELSLEQFLDIVQFGTFERFFNFLNKSYHFCQKENLGVLISSAHRLRNIVAHSESLLSKLDVRNEYGSSAVAVYLGQKGVKNKTLSTNLSKCIILDYCNLLYLYCVVEPYHRIKQNHKRLEMFLDEFCSPYKKSLENNTILVSSYGFFKTVIEIFQEKIE